MDSLPHRAYPRAARPDFLYVALDKAACAAFVKESRMNFANANQFHRKSGDHYPGTQTYRRNPKSSPDRMQPTPSFMDHLLWSSLLVSLPAYLPKGKTAHGQLFDRS